MPRVSFNRLSKKKSNVKKRRAGVISRSKFKPRTTTANRSLIQSNAYAIRAVKRMLPPPVWTDYQLSGTLFADTTDSPNFTTTIAVTKLMDPLSWRECLRRDENVLDSSTTRVLRMAMNLRYTMQASNWAQFSTFVVTIRPDAADRDLTLPNSIVINADYINSFSQDFNVRLNPAVFKVHYVRYLSLTKNTWLDTTPQLGNVNVAFNPSTTMAKGQVNMKMGHRIRNPILGAPWKDMELQQFSPNERYYLVTFIVQQAGLNPGELNAGARLDYDALFTCYNSS